MLLQLRTQRKLGPLIGLLLIASSLDQFFLALSLGQELLEGRQAQFCSQQSAFAGEHTLRMDWLYAWQGQ